MHQKLNKIFYYLKEYLKKNSINEISKKSLYKVENIYSKNNIFYYLKTVKLEIYNIAK